VAAVGGGIVGAFLLAIVKELGEWVVILLVGAVLFGIAAAVFFLFGPTAGIIVGVVFFIGWCIKFGIVFY
jgi:hypothetical protein